MRRHLEGPWDSLVVQSDWPLLKGNFTLIKTGHESNDIRTKVLANISQ